MEYNNKVKHSEYKRFCKTLALEDDQQLIEEYKKVHAAGASWPEITQGMIDVGILDMEIYLVGTQLFMIMDRRKKPKETSRKRCLFLRKFATG